MQIALTNQYLATFNGQTVPDHTPNLRRTFLVLDNGLKFIDTVRIRNFGIEKVVLPLSLELATTFESMFVLRGAPAGKRGRMHAPQWDGTALRFCYESADGELRTLLADFSLPAIVVPRTTERSVAHFEVALAPRETCDLVTTFRVDERNLCDASPG